MITVLVIFITFIFSLLTSAVPTIEGIDSAQANICCVLAINELYIDDVCAFTVLNCGGYSKCLQRGTSYYKWCQFCLLWEPGNTICLSGTWPPVGDPPAIHHRTIDIDLDGFKAPESVSIGINPLSLLFIILNLTTIRPSEFGRISKRVNGLINIPTDAADNLARLYYTTMGLTAWNLFVSASNAIAFTIYNFNDSPISWTVVDATTRWTTLGTLPASSHYGGSVSSLVFA